MAKYSNQVIYWDDIISEDELNGIISKDFESKSGKNYCSLEAELRCKQYAKDKSYKLLDVIIRKYKNQSSRRFNKTIGCIKSTVKRLKIMTFKTDKLLLTCGLKRRLKRTFEDVIINNLRLNID